MKRILVSIERPESEITGIVRWRVGKVEHAARFAKDWSDEKVMQSFNLEKEPGRTKK